MTTLSDLTTIINTLFATNTSGDIGADDARTVTIDIVTRLIADLEAGDAATLDAATGIVGGASLDPITVEGIDLGGNTINLFDVAKVTPNMFLFASGSTEAHGGTHISDYMIVKPGGSIISNHSEIFGGFSANGPVFYDKDKVRISNATNFDGINPITVPAGASYCRVNVLDSIKLTYMLLRSTSLPDHYIPFGMTSIKRVLATSSSREHSLTPFAELTKVRLGQIGAGATNFHPINGPGYIVGKVFSLSTGEQSDSIWDTTDYFPVPPGGQVTVTGWHDDYSGIGGYGITWWDADKNFISGTSFPFTDGQVISVPANAYFGRMTINPSINNDSNSRSFGIVSGNQPNFNHKFKAMPSLVNMHRPWTDKVWMAAGDSIVADGFNPWFRRVAEYHGCRYMKNVGVPGRSLNDMLKDGSGTTFPAGYFADVDMAFLMGPTNTMGSLITLGTISDTPSITGTFYAQMRAWVEFVLTDNPRLRVVLGTCLQRGGYETSGLPYQQAIRDVAAKYAVELWDPWVGSQFSPFTYSTYSGDGLHPNTGATDWTLTLGSRFAAFMHGVFPTDFIGDPLYGRVNFNRP